MQADSYARDEFPRNPKSPTVRAETGTCRHPALRGILLNPNADTDGDGLADGQELFVKSVKTPKRYPTRDQQYVETDRINPGLGAAPWAIQSVQAMVGFTHEDMGQISSTLYSSGPSPNWNVALRTYGNFGEANNFTSYDLLQRIGAAWLAPEDFVVPGRSSYLSAYDKTLGTVGQVEYLQLQVMVRTLPNRADTDADGLNDSKELNLGSDGFATDPWKAMCTPMRSTTPSSTPDGGRAVDLRPKPERLPHGSRGVRRRGQGRGRRRTASHVIINK